MARQRPRAGLLRNYITIQEPTETNTNGERTLTWSEYKTCWAAVIPVSGREWFDGQQTNSEVTHRIRTRYLSGVTTKMRITWDSRTFAIQSVINMDEGKHWLEIMAVEQVD